MLTDDTQRIIGSSTVDIERVSDLYRFYYNYRDIEQQKLHLLLLYIGLQQQSYIIFECFLYVISHHFPHNS